MALNDPLVHNHVGTNYYSFGVSFRNAPAHLRQHFALTPDQVLHFYHDILPQHHCAGFIVNTCNRTTFFLHGKHNEEVETAYLRLIQERLARVGMDAVDDLNEFGYRFIGIKAVSHLLEVCSGLDSQILGDFEIVGQIKKAFALAKEQGITDGLLERALNTAVHCSRKIKNETGLSSGSASTSYAAASFLRDHLKGISKPRVLILGTGEIGHRTLDNWIAMHSSDGVAIANRTDEKAAAIALKTGAEHLNWSDWKEKINTFDAVVSAVSTPRAILSAEHISPNGPKYFIDLSVPMSIDVSVAELPETALLDVDALSKRVATTMQSRSAALPEAYAIVKETLAKFKETERAHSAVPLIQQVQQELTKQWEARQHDPDKIERLSAKIECRLFEHVRKDPRQIQQLKKWLRE